MTAQLGRDRGRQFRYRRSNGDDGRPHDEFIDAERQREAFRSGDHKMSGHGKKCESGQA